MKKSLPAIILSILVVVAALSPVCADAKKKKAEIRFAESSYNFGNIPEKGGKVTHTFSFTNTGDANLVIIDATADCGCTLPQFSQQPIAPGKKGVIKVTYDPLYRPGNFTKTITVRSNAKKRKVAVKITGYVVPSK